MSGRGERMADGKRSRNKQTEMPMETSREGRIRVRICGREKGLEIFEKVNFVRVVSKRYNLLIMADYLPIIGEIEGAVFFRTADREYHRDHLTGYFMHKNNEFSLMLKSEGVPNEAVEAENE